MRSERSRPNRIIFDILSSIRFTKMQIKIFTIPLGAEESMTDEMNHFLRANKIIDVKRELAVLNGNSCWSFCISYMLSSKPITDTPKSTNGKIDYKEVLEPEAFERFSALRKIRKQIADKEAVPAYAVFTDAELAEMAKLTNISTESLLTIPGIGKKKVEKYGALFSDNNISENNETGGIFDGEDFRP